jgi:hypothetical protein
LIKTSDSLYIGSIFDISAAIGQRKVLMQESKGKSRLTDKITVSYEDYLIILMCFVNRETRLKRVADLIQLNMTERHGSGFSMDEAYTYIKADTKVTIKYMFQPIKQFTNSYKGSQLKLNNTIYQGY